MSGSISTATPTTDSRDSVRPTSTDSRVGAMHIPRTPRMRQRQRFDLSTWPEEDEIDGLEELVAQTWNIYAVSTLFDIEQDDVHFKMYSKKLREEIANTLSHENVTYDVKFSIMENIASKPNSEDPIIKIEVISKINSNENGIEKSIYKGILLSWSFTQTKLNIQNAIRLPLLLCRGTSSCMNAVHTIIGRMFDCLIVTLPANEDDLRWLVPIIITATNKDESIVFGEVQMEYTVPGLPVTDVIKVKFHSSNLKEILSVIAEDQDDRVNVFLDYEHIKMFHEVLHKQMLMIGGLHLGFCTLHRINLPGVTVMENRMKVTNVDIMNNILLYFSDKAFDIFHTVHIDI
ncbi:PREDICTED: centromere protein L-like [Cyphomyrmex costatus]|uniref:Centromere protein L n=1 Tax=Cyphomyrmex costatus TaxID=456900 RepID=A0A195CM69_9HYME|nr:PREDICTED: centromere protein L-like [Cyphomyrmex costatus]KYN01567.1 hypothetical protein ALC62_07749 [Cyphomyrmex costatus]